MSASFASTISRSNPSEWVSQQIATSMVWSDFGLSCFDYPLDRKNRDTVCTLLTDLPFKIIAVWVVGRPVNGYSNSKFEHWAVKIQAPPALISIDFLESKKKGAFGLQQTTATDAELEDFLHFFVRDDKGKKKKKWNIIASVTPSPLKNTCYLKYIDDYDLNKLKSYMTSSSSTNNKNNKNKSNNNKNVELIKHININRKVCDVADFLGMWTEQINNNNNNNINTKNNNNKEKTYNPITGNCQQFAADLFEYLVGHKKEYQQKVKDVKVQVQSPFDKKRYKQDIGKESKEKKLKHNKNIDDEKIEEIDQQKQNESNNNNNNNDLSNLNNPQSIHRVDSM